MTEVTTSSGNDIPHKEAFAKANEHRDFSLYTELMDAALIAKAQSLFPYFGILPDNAVIIDAGSGTGALAELAAREFRGATVYALDVSHELMELADNGRSLAKLVYGDASEQNFPDNSADVKYYSTSGHEIESFGGKGRMKQAVEVSFTELRPNGRLIIRDFQKPERTDPLFMSLPEDDGVNDPAEAVAHDHTDYTKLSTRALFLKFHEEFGGGNAFSYEEVVRDGKTFIKLSPEWAHEFYLRKDYRDNWIQESKEKYTYWTEDDARETLIKAGFKDVKVIPDPSEFILKNRLEGKVGLFEENESGELRPVPFPSTHMVIVGIKPDLGTTEEQVGLDASSPAIDYHELKQTVSYDEEKGEVRIGNHHFSIDQTKPIPKGSKKSVYTLAGEPNRVLKVVRTDGYDDHTIFKAMYQSIARTDILKDHQIPTIPILETDPEGPPYRYFIQEALPDDAPSAAELIKTNSLTETDIAQMAGYINDFELQKEWQLDTNPFNWYRITKEDGTTEMTYVDGKVYTYDEAWEFRKIGLLQWIDSSYVSGSEVNTAFLPKVKAYESLQETWSSDTREQVTLWKKYLSPVLQPKKHD